MSFETPPSVQPIDHTETLRVAARFAIAVDRYNDTVTEPDAHVYFRVHLDKDEVEPPIGSRDAEPGEVYTRVYMPGGYDTFRKIQDIEVELSLIETPRTV